MCIFKMGNFRIVDLTKTLDPATETRRCHLFGFNTGGRFQIYFGSGCFSRVYRLCYIFGITKKCTFS